LDLPILFLSDFINQNKKDYYSYLRWIDFWAKNSIKDFTLWLLLWIEIQALDTNITIVEIWNLMEKLKFNIKSDKELHKIYSHELIDYLFMSPFYSISN